MPGFSSVISMLRSFKKGDRLVDGGDCQQLVKFTASGGIGITALASGGQPGATMLTQYINRVDTVANAGDSVQLPPAMSGMEIQVINNTTTSLNIFPAANNPYTGASDTSATLASSTYNANAQALAGNGVAIFICAISGQWKRTV